MRAAPLLIIGLMLASAATAAPAQQARPAGTRNYDPSTVETVKGEVLGVDHVASPRARSGGVHLTIKTDSETISVHLGPAWYVDAQKPLLQKGDHVEVEGSRVSVDGKPAIIARQVQKDGQTLMLRNTAGVPVWAGRGGRARQQK